MCFFSASTDISQSWYNSSRLFFVTVVFCILLFSLIQALYVNVDGVSSSSDEDSSLSSLSQSFRIAMTLHFSHVLSMHAWVEGSQQYFSIMKWASVGWPFLNPLKALAIKQEFSHTSQRQEVSGILPWRMSCFLVLMYLYICLKVNLYGFFSSPFKISKSSLSVQRR